jgi:hypothetical protein
MEARVSGLSRRRGRVCDRTSRRTVVECETETLGGCLLEVDRTCDYWSWSDQWDTVTVLSAALGVEPEAEAEFTSVRQLSARLRRFRVRRRMTRTLTRRRSGTRP